MINNIRKSKFILISFQEKFEDIDNLKYFQNIRKQLKNTFKIKIIKNEFYNGNIFNRQNHYFFRKKSLIAYFHNLISGKDIIYRSTKLYKYFINFINSANKELLNIVFV